MSVRWNLLVCFALTACGSITVAPREDDGGTRPSVTSGAAGSTSTPASTARRDGGTVAVATGGEGGARPNVTTGAAGSGGATT